MNMHTYVSLKSNHGSIIVGNYFHSKGNLLLKCLLTIDQEYHF